MYLTNMITPITPLLLLPKIFTTNCKFAVLPLGKGHLGGNSLLAADDFIRERELYLVILY